MYEKKDLEDIIEMLLPEMEKKLKEKNINARTLRSSLEERRVDLLGLPQINTIKEEAFLHIGDETEDNKDNKIPWTQAQKSIRNIENAKIKDGEILGTTVPTPQASGHITNKEYVDNALITKAPIKSPEFNATISVKSLDNNLISYFSSNANGASPYFQILCYNAKSNTIVVPIVVRYVNNIFITTDIANANLTGANPIITNPPSPGDNSNKIATTAFVKNQDYATTTSINRGLALKANINSPTFTGGSVTVNSTDNNLTCAFGTSANGVNPFWQVVVRNNTTGQHFVPIILRYVNNIPTTTDIYNANLVGTPATTATPAIGDNSNKIATTAFCQRLKASRGSEVTFGLNQTINIIQYGFVYVAINNGNNASGLFSVYINGVANTLAVNGFSNQSFFAPVYAGDAVVVQVGDGSLSLTLGKIFYTNLSF